MSYRPSLSLALLALLLLPNCTYESSGLSSVRCTPPEFSQGRACVDGYWVTMAQEDMPQDLVSDVTNDADMCTPTTMAVACPNVECGRVDDGCAGQVDCGMCQTPGEMCDVDNTCKPACDCMIDGQCYAQDQPNPGNPCEVCKSLNASAWTPAGTNTACDDGDFCTAVDRCDGAGACQGSGEPDCSSSVPMGDDGLCKVAICKDNACGLENVAEGMSCGAGSDFCFAKECSASGTCMDELLPGFCLIENTCYRPNDTMPGNDCMACLPAQSVTQFSPVAINTDCTLDPAPTAQDLKCGAPACNSNGECVAFRKRNRDGCKVSNVCYSDGDANPANECEVCDIGLELNDWSSRTDGTECDAASDIGACLDHQCRAGTCEARYNSNFCIENNTCIAVGERTDGGTGCSECATGASGPGQLGTYTPVPQSTSCSTMSCSSACACDNTSMCVMP